MRPWPACTGTLPGMGSRLSIAAGLVAGVVVAFVLLVAFIFVGPDPGRPGASAAASTPPEVAASGTPIPTAVPSGGSASPSASGGSGEIANFHIGQPAPALIVPQVGGGTIDLTVLKGKPVWINFMQTTCEPCIEEFPHMNGFAARYSDQELVVIAIDIREEEGAVAAFAQSLNATFPLGLDTDGAAQRAWGAFALPTHYWVDKDGVVQDGALGGIGPDIMARGLGKILPGVEVTP
jgi:cytochrome c biogenesis protein CcmG, thiol:disulfide interchange protein DsbE